MYRVYIHTYRHINIQTCKHTLIQANSYTPSPLCKRLYINDIQEHIHECMQYMGCPTHSFVQRASRDLCPSGVTSAGEVRKSPTSTNKHQVKKHRQTRFDFETSVVDVTSGHTLTHPHRLTMYTEDSRKHKTGDTRGR